MRRRSRPDASSEALNAFLRKSGCAFRATERTGSEPPEGRSTERFRVPVVEAAAREVARSLRRTAFLGSSE